MITPSTPPDEMHRLKALIDLCILDTDPEPLYDAIAQCAAAITGCPIALISLVDESRQWFKAKVGLEVPETPRDMAFCAHAILSDDAFVVANAEEDIRFFDNPLVTGAPYIKGYLGAPIVDHNGHRLGTLCAIDHAPHAWSASEVSLIESLAGLVAELFHQRAAHLEAMGHARSVTTLTEDLAREKKRLADILEASGKGTVEWDIRAGKVQLNARAAALIECEKSFDHTTWEALHHPDDLKPSKAILGAHLAGRIPWYKHELRLRHRDGHWVWVEVCGKIIAHGEDGSPLFMSGTVCDVTERRNAAELLRSSVEELNAYFDLAVDLLCIYDGDSRLFRTSRSFDAALGYPPGGLTDKLFMEMVHPDDVEATRKVRASLAKGDTVSGFINRVRHRDGTFRSLEWHARPMGERAYAAARDVTDRIEAQNQAIRDRATADLIAEMRAQAIAAGSVAIAIESALQKLIDILDGAAGFVFELDRNADGAAEFAILARGRSRREPSVVIPADHEPTLALLADDRLTDEHRQLFSECLSSGYFFYGCTGAQLGASAFTGFPILAGAELISILALDEACAARNGNDKVLGAFLSAISDLMLAQRKNNHRREVEEKAKQLARADALTGLGNRRALVEEFEARTDHPDAQFGLIVIDLDRFKPINDVHGHAVGDQVLQAVAKRLKSVVRGDCAVIRVGGDEFAVMTEPDGDRGERGQRNVDAVAQRILRKLASPIRVGRLNLSVGASIGVSMYPADAHDITELMQFADAAMYRAKERRGAVQFFSATMDESIRKTAEIEVDLRAAIKADLIDPHFQPVVCLKTGKLVGHEVLARWTHPTRGAVSPATFIPIAEKVGLVDVLFWNMLGKACAAHMQAGMETLLSVNLSAAQMNDEMFAQRLVQVLARAGFPAPRLEVEVTESAMIRDLDKARAMLTSIRNQGVRIALDDFGTGYSSLVLLRELPIHKVKIDRSFVSGLAGAGGLADRKIVEAIIAMANALNLVVTAEGIETLEAAEALRNLGCEFGQGYLFGQARADIALPPLSEGFPLPHEIAAAG